MTVRQTDPIAQPQGSCRAGAPTCRYSLDASEVLAPGSMLDLAPSRNATETLREILDFDELAREVAARRQGRQGPQETVLPTSALSRFLRADATPREARLLIGALSLLGEWCVVIPSSPGCDGQSDRQYSLVRFVTR